MHTAADFFSKRFKYPKNTKLNTTEENTEEENTTEENNDKDWIFAKLEAYELCLIEAIEEEENKAFTNPELERRNDIFKRMKERVRKL